MQHDHMQNLVRVLRKRGINVYRQTFWMAHYNHPNFKLTKVWSTAHGLWRLDFGKLSKEQCHKHTSDTTKKYINAKGELRFTATSSLKKSQYFARVLLEGGIKKDEFVLWGPQTQPTTSHWQPPIR